MRLQGKTALITGAARGIGLAIARAFAREGADVLIADRDGEGAAAAAHEIGGAGVRALAIEMDVSQPEDVAKAIEELLRTFARVDVLVNNAGVGGNTPFLDTTLEEWERIIRINLTGAFIVAQAAAREMAK